MSSFASDKKSLLKLPKKELIRKCKEYKLLQNGSKSEMAERILKFQNKINAKDCNHNMNQNASIKPAKTSGTEVHLSRTLFYIVLTGYIRRIQRQMSTRTIPKEINNICHMYLIPNNLFLSMGNKQVDDKAYGSEIINIKLCTPRTIHNYITKQQTKHKDKQSIKAKRKIKLVELDQSKYQKVSPTIKYHSAVCQGTNIELPSKISDLITKKRGKYIDKTHDVIFLSGGSKHPYFLDRDLSDQCHAFIINRDYNRVYHWKLPELPGYSFWKKGMADHSMIYHQKYGLLTIWSSLNILSFKGDIYENQEVGREFKQRHIREQWKWRCFKHIHGVGVGSVCTLLGDKLFIAGGKDGINGHQRCSDDRYNYAAEHMKCVELLDFEERDEHGLAGKFTKLSDMKFGRWRAGIYHDKDRECIYVGGGDGNACQRIERYDIIKDKWMNVANTKYAYYHRPLVWVDNGDPDIIYMASKGMGERFEVLDLRMDHPYSERCRQKFTWSQPNNLCFRL